MRTSTSFGILFWLNKQKEIDGKALLYVRLTVNQKRLNISLKRKIPLDWWDAKAKKVKGNSAFAKELNQFLEITKAELYRCHQLLLAKGTAINPDDIKALFLGDFEQSKSLQELLKYHNEKIQNTLTKGTIKNFGVTENYINRFLKSIKIKDIHLSKLDYKFLCDFESYLSGYYPKGHPKAMSHNTVMKHIQRLRKIVTLAYHMEWVESDPFKRWKTTFSKKEREFLSDNELSNIATYPFRVDRLDRIRDVFLFSCYTGISFVDLKHLTDKNIWIGDGGKKWIITHRQKTNTKVKIPILETAEAVIQKYSNHPVTQVSGRLLPTVTNEKTNIYLKEVAEACGIQKNLTFHMARHTFATTVALSNGMPIETVSKILGHTKIATTQIYARVLDKKVEKDMDALQEILKQKELDRLKKSSNR